MFGRYATRCREALWMLTLVLIVLGLAQLRFELGPNVLEQLVQAGGAVDSGRSPSHATMTRVHGHLCDGSNDP